MEIELYNDDCFNVFPQIEDNTVNLFVLDLPYNQTACKWDKDIIPLDEMWKHIKRIMKPNGIVIHFCTAKFGYRLIHSNPKWFRYDLIWKKSRKVGFLSANKMPLRQHENIYLFKPEQGTYHPQKTTGHKARDRTENKKPFIPNTGYGNLQITANSTDETRHPTSIIDHENLYVFKPEQGTYNPQKTPRDKDYKHSGKRSNEEHYGNKIKCKKEYKKEDGKHPTSIIDHENLYVFSDPVNPDNTDDLDISRNKDLRQYAQKVKDYIGKSLKQINKDMGNRHAEHFFYIKSSQFGIPTETTYNKLIELYKLDEMPEFIPYETLTLKYEKNPPKKPKIETTYNPQKREGTPYKTIGKGEVGVYKTIRLDNENKGDRHPTSIIDHENLYVFSDACNDDLDISRNKDLRQYAQKVKDYIGKSLKQINKDMGNRHAEHFFYIKSSQFGIPTETTYNKLIDLYKLDEMPEFIPYETLKGMWEKQNETTYNPQKTDGKPYKTIGKGEVGIYKTKRLDNENKGDRHPSSLIDYDGDSILIYKNPHKTIHRTQKPVELCEWLIKTYSNEGDTVMDFTMGSGTVAIAAHNTKRKFIGVEKDPVIYELAEKRIADSCLE